MAFEIVVQGDKDAPRLDEVRALLRAHNLETNPAFMRAYEKSGPAPLSIVCLAGDGSVAGGLLGETLGRWLRVSIMAVRRDCRRQGLGTRILRAAELEARSRACDRAYLDTMDYQGPAFYEACGYARRCELEDWDSHGHTKFFYTKELER